MGKDLGTQCSGTKLFVPLRRMSGRTTRDMVFVLSTDRPDVIGIQNPPFHYFIPPMAIVCESEKDNILPKRHDSSTFYQTEVAILIKHLCVLWAQLMQPDEFGIKPPHLTGFVQNCQAFQLNSDRQHGGNAEEIG